MSSKKTIVILGATGAQGGSVVRTFLSHAEEYKIRALTRSTSSAKAQALSGKGVEVVEGDTSDMSSLVSAFKGASIVFGTTDFWGAAANPNNQAKAQAEGKDILEWCYSNEVSQGKNIFNAAAQTEGLERLIYSGLADISKWSGGKYTRSFHFDAKAHAINYARESLPELFAKTSVIQAGWYLDNWRDVGPLQPKQDESGTFEFIVNVPADLKLPLVAIDEDYGPLVKALVDESEAGLNLITYREYISVQDMAKAFAEVVKVPAKVTSMKLDVNSDNALLRELAQGYAFWEEFGYEAREDPTVIHPSQLQAKLRLGSVKDWLAKQNWSEILQVKI